ncbi:cobalt/nickel transport protein [Halopolyspora algeriensis]|uniref:Cobalt/nickel transport protein n=1 Tax=Halopolyspora algeriensis TaxID=1500506 RepID=A0A368VPF7_9ACTN|nr:PDGLE domain-containing protein [Halopolyspora algeriensis]RCW42865.1 cobalt/nickel transport protein [Halopolyspora algeriensis]TQM56665.1 cobalt/nickel transport protein [Halopolyspora algeriensis]
MSTAPRQNRRRSGFLLGFGLVALLLASGVSYFADSSPDGLEAVARQGCTVVETAQGEQLRGECIAQSTTEHALDSSPLADYTLGGNEALTGAAGAIGFAATLAVAGGLFWLLRQRGAERD